MKVLFRVAVAILILFERENRRWLQQEVTVFNLRQRIARFCQQPTFSPARLLKVQKTPCHLIFIYIYVCICVQQMWYKMGFQDVIFLPTCARLCMKFTKNCDRGFQDLKITSSLYNSVVISKGLLSVKHLLLPCVSCISWRSIDCHNVLFMMFIYKMLCSALCFCDIYPPCSNFLYYIR